MITEKITSDQEVQLNKFVADLIRKLQLSKDEAQEIISGFNAVKPEIEQVFKKHVVSGKRFGAPIREFQITVPTDYKHESQIDAFAQKVKGLKKTYHYNNDLTSANFAKATNKLEPGKTYLVKIHLVLKTVQSDDCMAFLKKQHSILVGGQGLTLIYELRKEEFPEGKYTVSFDEKDALWVDSGGSRRVPYVRAHLNGGFSFSLGGFEGERHDNDCLVSVCEIPSGTENL